MIPIDSCLFPLTNKFKRLLRKYSLRYKLPFAACVQESYLVEWELVDTFEQHAHRLNYFKKVIKQRITKLYLYERCSCEQSESYLRDLFRLSERSGATSLFDLLIDVRPFDEYFYEDLVLHLKIMLVEIDVIASQIFTARMSRAGTWKELYENHFSESITLGVFYRKVQLIKKVAEEEFVLNG